MSVWPWTSTRCWRVDVLGRAPGARRSTSPAWTLVIWCGDSIEWRILRASRVGASDSDLAVPRYVARSFGDHSHSRLDEEVERRRERVGVQRGLDLEHLDAGVDEHLAHPPVALVQLRAVLVHEAVAGLHGRRVVVVAQAAVAGQAGGRRLPPAVHGDEVDVDVDEQVRRRRPLVDLDLLAVLGRAEVQQVVGVLGVVLAEHAARLEGVVDPVADGVAQLGLGHPPVQGEGADRGGRRRRRPRRRGRARPR